MTSQGGRERILESGLLEDIHFITNTRSNSIIVLAPEKTMALINAVIDELDSLHTAIQPKVTVFPLHHADAETAATLLRQLLFGTTTGTTGGGPGGTTATIGQGGTGITNVPVGQVPLLNLTIGVDDRSNSIILTGPAEVVAGVEDLINRLDLADEQAKVRRSEVYSLHNASAADVANAINTFFSNQLAITTTAGINSAYIQLQQQVFIVPEPITNKLLISATPYYFDTIMRFVTELDQQPPQVVIQCLLAEVDLSATEEFGVEFGLQSPIMFARSLIPTTSGGTSSFTSSGTPTILTTTSATSNIAATSTGFNFSSANSALPIGNNIAAAPATVGFSGLGNLGVGRTDPTLGFGGFVFTAASNSFNLLIRALKVQGRIDILSRPQLTTLDNQTANILIGQSVPYSTGSSVTGTGITTTGVAYRDTGVLMNVTPRISPDGRVLMRIQPEVSKLSPTEISVGGVLQPQFDVQSVQTTVAANDGETIVIGGLIQKSDQKNENKIPWFGDLPYVGAAFRYRTQVKKKVELLVILTPHVVRNKADAERVLFEESRRMDWIVGDVLKSQGTSGMEPIIPAPGGQDGRINGPLPFSAPGYSMPAPAASFPAPGSIVLPPPTPLSAPTPLPPGAQQGSAPAPGAAAAPATVPPVAQPMPTGPMSSAGQGSAPVAARQEERQWTVMPKRQ
jgi:type II secretory pathway component GspD/PulD (secretin)